MRKILRQIALVTESEGLVRSRMGMRSFPLYAASQTTDLTLKDGTGGCRESWMAVLCPTATFTIAA
jgi:hypothetical protein